MAREDHMVHFEFPEGGPILEEGEGESEEVFLFVELEVDA